jgi:hypothetical protein
LQVHHIYVLNNLDCDSSQLLSTLYESKVIDDIQKNKLNKLLATSNPAEELLSMVSRKSAAQFDLFLLALRNTGQGYIADQLSSTLHSIDIDECLEQYTGESIIYFCGVKSFVVMSRVHCARACL